MGDVDIFCATRLWFSLLTATGWSVFTPHPNDRAACCDPPYLYKVMEGLEVNIFFNWRRRGVGDIDVPFWMNNPVMVAGYPCTDLNFMLDWKRSMGRAKDHDDIIELERHLGKGKHE